MPFPLHWHTEPLLLGGLLSLGWLYALMMGPYRAVWASDSNFPYKSAGSFFTCLGLAYLAVGSPLDQIGEDFLFSVHMVQHLLIAIPIPLLLMRGMPTAFIDNLLDYRLVRVTFRFLMHPATAGLCFTLTYTLWHMPNLYEWALADKRVHIVEHLMMFLVAFQMWWPLASPSHTLPKAVPPVQLLYIILLMIGQFPVFGLLTLSDECLYATYTLAPHIVSWSPWQDQVLGGVIMNGVSMAAYFSFFAYAFYVWYQAEEGIGKKKIVIAL